MSDTTIRVHDGTRDRLVTGRLAAMIRRLLEHEAEIARFTKGSIEIGFDGSRIFARLQATLDGRSPVS